MVIYPADDGPGAHLLRGVPRFRSQTSDSDNNSLQHLWLLPSCLSDSHPERSWERCRNIASHFSRFDLVWYSATSCARSPQSTIPSIIDKCSSVQHLALFVDISKNALTRILTRILDRCPSAYQSSITCIRSAQLSASAKLLQQSQYLSPPSKWW